MINNYVQIKRKANTSKGVFRIWPSDR